MNRIYFTADTHFGHQLMAKKRGFATVEEHDTEIIEKWNSQIDGGDRVYILGDMIWNGVEPADILKQLNGEKYLIEGNHDRIGKHNEAIFLKYVKWIKDYFVLKIKNGDNIPSTKIVLCHYPFEIWDADHYGSFHLFGHIHGRCRHKPLSSLPNRMDVGVDTNDLYPYEWTEILEKFKKTGMYKKDYREELAKADEEEKKLDLLMKTVPFGYGG